MIVWDGLNEEERECNALDVNGKTLGTVETTRLLVDNEEDREHSRRQIAITSGGSGVVSDGQRGKD